LGHDAVVVIRLLDIDGQDVFVGHGGDELEELLGIGTDDDFVGEADVFLELVGVQHHVDEDGVGLGVEVDDLHALFGKGYGDIGQDVFDGRYHVADRLDLETLDSQDVVFLVHGEAKAG